MKRLSDGAQLSFLWFGLRLADGSRPESESAFPLFCYRGAWVSHDARVSRGILDDARCLCADLATSRKIRFDLQARGLTMSLVQGHLATRKLGLVFAFTLACFAAGSVHGQVDFARPRRALMSNVRCRKRSPAGIS